LKGKELYHLKVEGLRSFGRDYLRVSGEEDADWAHWWLQFLRGDYLRVSGEEDADWAHWFDGDD
jgi:hypothetical protein